MAAAKYFDHIAGVPLNPESDGCLYDDWQALSGETPFARHHGGFLVFLPPEELKQCDEYSGADPYFFESEGNVEFTSRRVEGTLTLLDDAFSRIAHKPKLLDIGAGQGHITARIRERFPEVEISALDYSLSAVEFAAANYPGIDFVVASAYECPYANDYFDVVVCNNIWEHVPDPLRMLDRVDKVINPGGYLIISTPSRYRLRNIINVLKGKPVRFMSKHHVTEYTVGQVAEQLRFGGYEVERIYSKPIPEWGPKSNLIKLVLSAFLKLVGSHHLLESTVFFLARPATDRRKG